MFLQSCRVILGCTEKKLNVLIIFFSGNGGYGAKHEPVPFTKPQSNII